LSDDGSSDSKYLLDEEEARGHGKLYLAIFILLVLAGLAYFQWRQGGFDSAQIRTTLQGLQQKWLGKTATNAAAAAPANPANAETPAAVTPGSASSTQPAPAAAPPANGSATGATGAGASNTATPNGSSVAPSSPANNAAAGASAASNTRPPEGSTSATNSSNNAGDDDSEADAAETNASDANDNGQPGTTASRTQPPRADVQPDSNNDALINSADNYLYGRGVPRDCDRAISSLRQAADQSSKAMSKLGGLYATGNCVPRDLPTAYHWFALALRQDRKNSYVEHDLQIVWNQMSAEEKQRALHMSQ
jgi:hypothetical protein